MPLTIAIGKSLTATEKSTTTGKSTTVAKWWLAAIVGGNKRRPGAMTVGDNRDILIFLS